MNMGQDRKMLMVKDNGGNQFRQYARQNAGNQIRYNAGQIARNHNGYNAVQNARNQVGQNAIQNPGIQNVGNLNGIIVILGNANQNRNGNVVATRAEGNGNGNNANQIRRTSNKEIEDVNVNCILMANLHQASSSGTQTDKSPIYDSDGSSEDDSNVILADSNIDPSGETVEHHPATVEETRAFYESLYNNLVIEVEIVNTVNRKMKEANIELTAELARYKGQEKCFEFNQAKFDELENGYISLFIKNNVLLKRQMLFT
ncbi:hypothetical protein Tco_0287376 [Tanacetum coccineum]